MKKLTLTLSSMAVLALTACQTTGAVKSADELLFSAIPAEKISTEGAAISQLSTSNPTCVSFYQNAAKFAGLPEVAPKAPGGGFGVGLLKTIAFGTVAGAASGGVGSLGIGSSFLELALAGAANQVVFQGSNAAFNAVTGDGGANVAGELPALSPLSQIEAAAAKIGCPAPDADSLGLDPLPVGGATTTGDHTHSAGEHTHTTNGQTYSHTH